jgi:hypothetical protein
MIKRVQRLLSLTVGLSLVLSACCGRTTGPPAEFETPTGFMTFMEEPTDAVVMQEPTEPMAVEAPTDTTAMQEPDESGPYEPPVVGLDTYHDMGNAFFIFVVNPNRGPLADGQVRVVLYDGSGEPVTEEVDDFFCEDVEAYSECSSIINFDDWVDSSVFTTFNIFVEATSPQGQRLAGQLSEQPISIQEGLAVSEGRRPPTAFVRLEWTLPSAGYRPGAVLESNMTISQTSEGRIEERVTACLRISELRQYTTGRQESVTLTESCDQITLSEWPGDTLFNLDFTPSGYSWVLQESDEGEFRPLSIQAEASLTYNNMLMGGDTQELQLPPVEVGTGWWECNGYPASESQPGETCTANVVVRTLADDPRAHPLEIMVRYTEQDPEEWLVSGLLLFIPCLLGLCSDEAVVETQAHDLPLSAGEETHYSVQVQLPAHPTGEIGTSGYFYLAVAFEGITVWRGAELSVSEP